jgi:phosphotransferase system  glucose/maltose/N-acetylglucosamine-specific IIC component
MIRDLIYGFVTLLIGVAFLGPLNEMIETVVSNLTGFAATVTGLIVGFFALSLVAVGVALVVKAFGPSLPQ